MDLQALHNFEDVIRERVPGFKVAFKDESPSQKVLGFLMQPFNPTYMTKFISTFSPVVYFPSREYYESNPKSSFIILAHELVHLLDTQKAPLWFRASYLFPQILALFAFAAYIGLVSWHAYPLAILLGCLLLGCGIATKLPWAFWIFAGLGLVGSSALAVWTGGWASAAFFAGLVLLAPWPAPWRVKWELRGYAVNLAVTVWSYNTVPALVREMVVRHFIKGDYYFMSWSRAATEAALDEFTRKSLSGEICAEEPYETIRAFWSQNG